MIGAAHIFERCYNDCLRGRREPFVRLSVVMRQIQKNTQIGSPDQITQKCQCPEPDIQIRSPDQMKKKSEINNDALDL